MKTSSQPQLSTCSRTDCNGFVSSRQASIRTLGVLKATRPHPEEVHLPSVMAAPGNSPSNKVTPGGIFVIFMAAKGKAILFYR